MRAVDLIQKKKEGNPLTRDEIAFLIQGFTQNTIPDYQMSAFLMACCFRQPNFEETLLITREMLGSGKTVDLSHIPRMKIDKHSTGGVGDKTSLVITPLVASSGIVVPMVSGRSLGHTGGTLDKLESIPGFNVNLSLDEFKKLLAKSGMAMMGQTADLVPADKKMYALRDVTATIACIPLIAASIMSKKLAEGADGIVLDVKFGSGAFMKTIKEARELSAWLIKIAKAFHKKIIVLLTDMNQPLGNKVGNSLEVEEAIEVLQGGGPLDLKELSLELAAHMIFLGRGASSVKEALFKAKGLLENGTALEKFKEMVKQQGGDARIVENFAYLPKAKRQQPFQAQEEGTVLEAHAGQIGKAAAILGCGRFHMGDQVDPAAGFVLHKKVGSHVQKNEALLTIYYNDEKNIALVEKELYQAYRIGSRRGTGRPLIMEILGDI